jgi:DNA polymerase-3 subunit delta'
VSTEASADLYGAVVGQERAVEQLRRAARAPVHAYLLVGPPGSTKDEAARAFAAELLGAHGARDDRLALAGEHPDIREVVRTGPAISADQAREVIRLAALAPVEGDRKVLVLHELHLLRPEGAAMLLKTIEEPPPSTSFVVLADFVPPDLTTIASRCVRIEFRSIPDPVLEARLREEGVEPDVASSVVRAAEGDLARARILALDPSLDARRGAFASIPRRLDGTGATVVTLTAEVLGLIDQAAAPLAERHALESSELEARAERFGERGSGRKQLEERHRRELRRHRIDELRSGLGALAGIYRDLLAAGVDPGHGHAETFVAAVDRIHAALEALERNPNEPLLLQSLLWSLPAAPS